jgi:hypothetical protein
MEDGENFIYIILKRYPAQPPYRQKIRRARGYFSAKSGLGIIFISDILKYIIFREALAKHEH